MVWHDFTDEVHSHKQNGKVAQVLEYLKRTCDIHKTIVGNGQEGEGLEVAYSW